jgi:hypothetical protein
VGVMEWLSFFSPGNAGYSVSSVINGPSFLGPLNQFQDKRFRCCSKIRICHIMTQVHSVDGRSFFGPLPLGKESFPLSLESAVITGLIWGKGQDVSSSAWLFGLST